MADKYIQQVAGALSEKEGLVTSAGAADTGKIPALGADGKLSSTMLPATAVDTLTITVEDAAGLAAGDLVNIFDNAATPKVRRADASNGRAAHGYVVTAYADAASAIVHKEGTNDQLSTQTAGTVLYLSGTTPGAATATAPSTATHIVQRVGLAISATEMDWEPSLPITLA